MTRRVLAAVAGGLLLATPRPSPRRRTSCSRWAGAGRGAARDDPGGHHLRNVPALLRAWRQRGRRTRLTSGRTGLTSGC